MRSIVSLALLASAQALMVNVTCPNAPVSYNLNGVENGNLTVTAGDRIWFDIDCASDPFQITNSSGAAFLEGINPSSAVAVGMVELNTSASTPAMLGYMSLNNTGMMGWIIVKSAKASTPTIISVTQVQYFADLNITWSAGSAGTCVFDSWRVLFASGGVGEVPGCGNLTNVSVVTCRATLSSASAYTFTVQRVCVNSIANSDISIVSGSQTTVSTAGTKVCQFGSVCDCGNATICTCQGVDTCNCQNAATCVCQGGTCNGGNAGTLVCNIPLHCNKQCAKSCPVCIGDTISSYFGSDSCSDAFATQASLALVATALAFSW